MAKEKGEKAHGTEPFNVLLILGHYFFLTICGMEGKKIYNRFHF